MSSTEFIYAAREGGRVARLEARQATDAIGFPSLLVHGKVLADNGNGSYQVQVFNDAGAGVGIYDYAVPIPAATLSVDQIVWLVQWPGNPVPAIIQTGSGGASCFQSYTEWGAFFG